MRILFTTGDPYLPQQTGGAQSSTDQLARGLRAREHEVAVMCRLEAGGWTEFAARVSKRVRGGRFARDRVGGYPVFRAWEPDDATEVARQFRPDVAVVQNGRTLAIARSLEAAGVPVVVYFRNVEFDELGGNPSDLCHARFIANSAYTARRHADAFGIDCTVIPPLVEPEHYRTPTTREVVTFINPYPLKGVEVVLQVAARCPDIPFRLLESWVLNDDWRATLSQRLEALPNVALLPRTPDMRAIYGRTRLLLAPSLWNEAWGRVATEAQCSGIPVIGSDRGGLPEAIGPGGLVLDPTGPIEPWVAAVRRLWDDEDEWQRLSRAALDFAARPEIQPDHQLERLLAVLQAAAGQPRRLRA